MPEARVGAAAPAGCAAPLRCRPAASSPPESRRACAAGRPAAPRRGIGGQLPPERKSPCHLAPPCNRRACPAARGGGPLSDLSAHRRRGILISGATACAERARGRARACTSPESAPGRSPTAKAGPKLGGAFFSAAAKAMARARRASAGADSSRRVRAHRQRVIEDLRVLGNVDTVVRPRVPAPQHNHGYQISKT